MIKPNLITVYRKNKDDSDTIQNSDDLMKLLTQDIIEIESASSLNNYKKIIKKVFGAELTELLTKRGRRSDDHKHLIEVMETNNKYKTYIRKWIMEGKRGNGLSSYRELSKNPFILPINPHDQLQKLLTNMGSIKAGNNNPELLKEVSTLLDSLLKENIINKSVYKILFHKTKDMLISNK